MFQYEHACLNSFPTNNSKDFLTHIHTPRYMYVQMCVIIAVRCSYALAHKSPSNQHTQTKLHIINANGNIRYELSSYSRSTLVCCHNELLLLFPFVIIIVIASSPTRCNLQSVLAIVFAVVVSVHKFACLCQLCLQQCWQLFKF